MLQSQSSINPFSKNYSTQSILKRNYEYIAEKNHIKNQPYTQKVQKQNKYISKLFQNPFQKSLPLSSRINPFYSKQYQKNNYRINSLERSKFQSLDRNRNYKGLTTQNYKNQWRKEIQKNQREKLKNWGAQALRYRPQTLHNSGLTNFQYNSNANMEYSKRSSRISEDIMDQYYAQNNEKTYQNQFQTSKLKISKQKTIIKKKVSQNQDYHYKKLKLFGIQNSIPQSVDQDNITRHFIADKLNNVSSFDTIKQNQSKLSLKRNSIECFKNSLHGDSSSSGFYGTSSDMYQSGPSNFKLINSKKGPLDASDYDQDPEQQDLYNSPNFNNLKHQESYPTLITYNQKIYFKIQPDNK